MLREYHLTREDGSLRSKDDKRTEAVWYEQQKTSEYLHIYFCANILYNIFFLKSRKYFYTRASRSGEMADAHA